MKKFLINFLKGLTIGSTMIVPGVSGGSMAIILNIYDKLVDAASNLFKNFKENFLFIFSVALGGLTGLLIFARVIKKLLEVFELPTIYFFMGAILGSIPLIIGKTKGHKLDWKTFVFPLIGIACVVGLSFLPTNGDFVFEQNFTSYAFILITGIVASISLLLPGLSTTYMLLILGVYDDFITALTNFNIGFIAALAVSVIIGLVITIKILDYLIKNFPRYVFLIILGFVVGSIYTIFPGFPKGMNILYSVLLFFGGFVPIFLISVKYGGKE